MSGAWRLVMLGGALQISMGNILNWYNLTHVENAIFSQSFEGDLPISSCQIKSAEHFCTWEMVRSICGSGFEALFITEFSPLKSTSLVTSTTSAAQGCMALQWYHAPAGLLQTTLQLAWLLKHLNGASSQGLHYLCLYCDVQDVCDHNQKDEHLTVTAINHIV